MAIESVARNLGGARQGADVFRRYDERSGVTLTLVLVTVVGLFVEIWSHGQPGFTETFFSPWHAGFILAFLGAAGWMLWPVVAASRAGTLPVVLPRSYRLDVTGVLLFAVGLAVDIGWHTIFGVETSVAALTSPPHVLMISGTFLMASGPFRAAWAQTEPSDTPSLRTFMRPLLSITLVASMMGLALIYLWGFTSSHYMTLETFSRLARMPISANDAQHLRNLVHGMGVGTIYLSTAVLVSPILLMLMRWHLPFGAITIYLTITIALMAGITGFFMPSILAVPVVTGVIADWAVRRLRPSRQRIGAFRAFAAGLPVVLWSLYVGAVHVQWGVAWPPELWAGAILWTGVEGFGLSLMAVHGR